MLWAGAMPDVAQKYVQDFKATCKTMVMNHRSAPKLLSLQKALYTTLNEKEVDIIPGTKYESVEGTSTLAIFDNEDGEQSFIRNKIYELLNSGVEPREICVLAKRSIHEYLDGLIDFEFKDGIKLRNEVVYQDLLKEDVVNLILAMLLCAISTKDSDAYMYIQDVDLGVRGIDIDDVDNVNSQYLKLESYLQSLNKSMHSISISGTILELRNVIDGIFSYLGEKAYKDMYPQYENGDFLEENIEKLCHLLWEEYLQYNDWEKALSSFKGEMSIPAMTIHKSKGLEYDTVFVVGIEDGAFFASNRDISTEDASAFFVAVSRSKRNLYITTSKTREKISREKGKQSYKHVAPLYRAIKDFVNTESYKNDI